MLRMFKFKNSIVRIVSGIVHNRSKISRSRLETKFQACFLRKVLTPDFESVDSIAGITTNITARLMPTMFKMKLILLKTFAAFRLSVQQAYCRISLSGLSAIFSYRSQSFPLIAELDFCAQHQHPNISLKLACFT